MRPISPNEIIGEEFSTGQIMRACLHLSEEDAKALADGTFRVTEENAKILAEAFGTTAEFWLNLQKSFDERTNKK